MANPKEAGQAEAFQGRVSVSVPDQTSQWGYVKLYCMEALQGAIRLRR